MINEMKNKAGFSLVEVLFALLVLSVGVSAVSVLMTSSIKNAIVAKNQVIASELAQEGVELVTNLKANDATFTSTGRYAAADNYRIDVTTPDTTSFAVVAPALQKLYLSSGIYSHVAGTATNFYRKIKIEKSGTSVIATGYVTWNGTGVPTVCNIANKCVSVQAVLPD